MLKEPSEKQYKSALEYIDHLLSDEKEFERWANRVMEGWLKRKGYRKSSKG